MAFTVNPLTLKITIPKADLTLISGTLYQLDTNSFRLDLKAFEATTQGITMPKTHVHNTESVVAGVTYARTVEIINGYSVEFEDGLYSVRLTGSNNNIFDIQSGILVQNQVQVIPTNSAGLQTVSTGSGLSAEESTAVIGSYAQLSSIEGPMGHKAMQRMFMAILCGESRDADTLGPVTASTTTIEYMSMDGSKFRLKSDVDGSGTRTNIILDAS